MHEGEKQDGEQSRRDRFEKKVHARLRDRDAIPRAVYRSSGEHEPEVGSRLMKLPK